MAGFVCSWDRESAMWHPEGLRTLEGCEFCGDLSLAGTRPPFGARVWVKGWLWGECGCRGVWALM